MEGGEVQPLAASLWEIESSQKKSQEWEKCTGKGLIVAVAFYNRCS